MSDTLHNVSLLPRVANGKSLTVVQKTSDYTLTAADCDGFTVFTTGDNAVKFTLPSASFGLKARFLNNSSGKTMYVYAANGQTVTTQTQIAQAYVQSGTAGAAIEFLATSSSNWLAQTEKVTFGQWYLGVSATNGFFTGGASGSYSNTVEKMSLISLSGASNWGSLTNTHSSVPANASSSTNGFVSGPTNGNDYSTNIESFTFASFSTTGTWGALLSGHSYSAGCNNQSVACVAGGSISSGTYTAAIERFSMASTSNAAAWSNLTSVRYTGGAGVSSPTYGIVMGGFLSGASLGMIEYFPFSSSSNAVSWGSLVTILHAGGSTSSDNRGFLHGGYSTSAGGNISTTQTISFAAIGNATNWNSNLVTAKRYHMCASSPTKGFSAGGFNGSSYIKTTDVVSFIAQGGATSWGSLSVITDSGSGHQG